MGIDQKFDEAKQDMKTGKAKTTAKLEEIKGDVKKKGHRLSENS